MKQASEQILVALKVLRPSHQFKQVMQWVRESLADQDEANRGQKDDVLLRQGQGRALELSDFIKTVDTASEASEAIRLAEERHAQDREQY